MGEVERWVDLHVHTSASDGALAPAGAVKAAKEAGLAAVAITDHDTVAGLDEAIAAGNEYGIEVVPGIEISTIYGEKTEVHILGYFINHHDPILLEQMQILINARWERAKQIVEKLNALGIAVNFDRVVEIAQGGAIGRPHVARAMCETGAVYSIDSAFGKYLIEGCPAFVPRYKISPVDAVHLIRSAGGVACCAHVAKLKRDEIVVELIKEGLQAVEAWHPDHGSAGARFYSKFARTRGLIATGGSDAHCIDPRRPKIGDVRVIYEVVEELKRATNSF